MRKIKNKQIEISLNKANRDNNNSGTNAILKKSTIIKNKDAPANIFFEPISLKLK